MTERLVKPDAVIRPNGQVERMNRPAPAAVGGSYAPLVRLALRGEAALRGERRLTARYPERPLRGRLVDRGE
jgi:hypothetical protein